jgi:hypothetical protein
MQDRAMILHRNARGTMNRHVWSLGPGRKKIDPPAQSPSQIALNGKILGTISGLDFANAMLSIWLGPNPLDQTLKKALLGLSEIDY